MGKLTVLIGLARSGKSTWAIDWQTYIFNNGPLGAPRVIVNSDQIRLAIHGERYNKHAEPFVRAATMAMVKSLYNQGYDVLIDETNTTVGSIRQWLEVDPDAKFVYLDTSVEVCQQRARDSGQPDLINVIPRMYDNLLNLCNYTITKRLNSGEEDLLSMHIKVTDIVNEDDIMMSIEDIRNEVKHGLHKK